MEQRQVCPKFYSKASKQTRLTDWPGGGIVHKSSKYFKIFFSSNQGTLSILGATKLLIVSMNQTRTIVNSSQWKWALFSNLLLMKTNFEIFSKPLLKPRTTTTRRSRPSALTKWTTSISRSTSTSPCQSSTSSRSQKWTTTMSSSFDLFLNGNVS